MYDQSNPPEFVIGVDFGQTYTGVVWTKLGDTEKTRPIDAWPGLPPHSVETKVPTKIAYSKNGREPRWGFLCDEDDDDEGFYDVQEHFKIYLDQDSLDLARKFGVTKMETVEQATQLVTDYLHQVYLHIKRSLESAFGPWMQKSIEFVFSLPTTWTSSDTINRFKKAIEVAGFRSGNPQKHTYQLDLTEAEAAAVYTASEPQVTLFNNDIILICDAGGGTTDLGLIQVQNADRDRPTLKQVNAVRGIGIGSTMIDLAFELYIKSRLETSERSQSLPDTFAPKVARSQAFLTIKHNFGIKAMEHETYKLPLHKLDLGIGKDYTDQVAGIEGGVMQLPRTQVQIFFDTQIEGIFKQIRKQLDWMREHRAYEQVKVLVLSGGLGGSQYVMTKIQERLHTHPHPSAPNISIIKSREPRLVVVKGLVINRKQQLTQGGSALKTRIARASYGVLCKQLYDPAKYPHHVGANVVIDPLNKKQKFATGQVDWIIRKGDPIDADTAREREFTRKVIPGDTTRRWDTTILISHAERDRLPEDFRPHVVLRLCNVMADMKEIRQEEFKLMNKRCWQGKKYYNATFSVKVAIAPADLKFELWFNGKKYNRSHDPISIEFDAVGAAAKPRVSIDVAEVDGHAWEGKY